MLAIVRALRIVYLGVCRIVYVLTRTLSAFSMYAVQCVKHTINAMFVCRIEVCRSVE